MLQRKQTFPILCLDPSLTAFGFVVIINGTVKKQGCIKTKPAEKKLRIRKGDDKVNRISEINHILKTIIQKYKIKYIVSELPHGSQSATAAAALWLVTGMVQTISDMLEIGIEWYSEADAKKELLQKKSATKTEIIKAIDKIYSINWTNIKYKDEAIADALAIYNVAFKFSPVLKAFSKNDNIY